MGDFGWQDGHVATPMGAFYLESQPQSHTHDTASASINEKYGQPPVGTDAALHQYIVQHTREPQVWDGVHTWIVSSRINHASSVYIIVHCGALWSTQCMVNTMHGQHQVWSTPGQPCTVNAHRCFVTCAKTLPSTFPKQHTCPCFQNKQRFWLGWQLQSTHAGRWKWVYSQDVLPLQ